MKDRTAVRSRGFLVGLAMVAALAPAVPALAHCDTVDGPVVGAARQALARGDVTPVLKWVGPEHEVEVAAAFAHVLAVRPLGDDARELADRFFFETLVRLHREGEGVSYVGLKEAGSPVSPAVLAADLALESGSVDDLTAEITGAIDAGVQERFRRAREMRMRAEESVAAGREFVAAYVGFTHYVETLEALAAGHPVEHGTEAAASSKGTHGEAHEIEEPLPSPVFELPQEVGYGPAPTRPTAEIRRSGTGYTATHPSSRKICGTSFVFERFGPLGDTIGLSEPESCPKQVNTGNVTS